MEKLRLGVLVSGHGSNLEAILEACKQKTIAAQVAVVVSNNPKAFALQRAQRHQVSACIVRNGEASESEIIDILKKHQVGLVCLAGFMKILSPAFLKHFSNRVINIHPALLPAFPGLRAQAKALAHGVKITGATVHFVDAGCDTGPIILQSAVPVLEEDTEESLRQRILKEEHRIYPQAIDWIATQSLKIVGRRVIRINQKGEL